MYKKTTIFKLTDFLLIYCLTMNSMLKLQRDQCTYCYIYVFCPYCKEPDSILHTFVECYYTQAFYVKVVDWFNAKLNCSFSPTPLETLFGTDLATSRNNQLKFKSDLL